MIIGFFDIVHAWQIIAVGIFGVGFAFYRVMKH